MSGVKTRKNLPEIGEPVQLNAPPANTREVSQSLSRVDACHSSGQYRTGAALESVSGGHATQIRCLGGTMPFASSGEPVGNISPVII